MVQLKQSGWKRQFLARMTSPEMSLKQRAHFLSNILSEMEQEGIVKRRLLLRFLRFLPFPKARGAAVKFTRIKLKWPSFSHLPRVTNASLAASVSLRLLPSERATRETKDGAYDDE